MRILLVTKFYYERGGDCTATFAQESLLEKSGHEVAIFAMSYPLNKKNQWALYFAPKVEFSNPSIKRKIEAAMRIFGGYQVQSQFALLLDRFKPDVVHLQNIHSYLSPVVAKIAHQRGIKVVWTLHDYKLVCPAYTCLRNELPCRLCLITKLSVLTEKCFNNSLSSSLMGYLEALYWNKKRIDRWVDHYIAPSSFMKKMLVKGGFDKSKITVINNFIDLPAQPFLPDKKRESCCYIGRLSEEKGLRFLLENYPTDGLPLYIVGTGPLHHELQYSYQSDRVSFLGHQTKSKVYSILSQARFSIIPSQWYENNPYSLIESLCLGTPVLGANIGGIPELINEGYNGSLFTYDNAQEFRRKYTQLRTEPLLRSTTEIAEEAHLRFGTELYYEKIKKLYEQ